jgi:cystinosin
MQKEGAVNIISDIAGWSYFVCWSISFYPQIWVNWRRKSVVGFSFDYLALNIFGYMCYSIFNLVMYLSPIIQEQYKFEYNTDVIPTTVSTKLIVTNSVKLVQKYSQYHTEENGPS